MPFGTRTMSSNGSSGSSIQTQIDNQIRFAGNDLQQKPPELVKQEIDDRTNSLINRYGYPTDVVISNVQTTSNEKIAALQSLKDNGIKYFILNFDTTKSNSEYAPQVAYIQTLFNGFKTMYPTDEWVVSYETPSQVEPDIAQQIDAEIAKLQDASVQATPVAKSSFFGRFGFGGRKQKRTKKKSKRKTKKHKKKRTRRR